MNRVSLCLSAFLAFAVVSNSLARIGETEKECEERYGAPIQYAPADPNVLVPGTQERWFQKSPLYIRVLFKHGKAVCLFFEGRSGMINSDIEKPLLEANASGEWKRQNAESDFWLREFGVDLGMGPRTWHSASGDRIAYRVYEKVALGLMIANMDFYNDAKDKLEYFQKRVIDRRNKIEQERMKGF